MPVIIPAESEGLYKQVNIVFLIFSAVNLIRLFEIRKKGKECILWIIGMKILMFIVREFRLI